MDLWIRSQDREKLMRVKEIIYQKGIFENSEANAIIGAPLYDDNAVIGIYNSRERALEVLDEIHQRIINIQFIQLCGAGYISNQMKKSGLDIVFEMPKE